MPNLRRRTSAKRPPSGQPQPRARRSRSKPTSPRERWLVPVLWSLSGMAGVALFAAGHGEVLIPALGASATALVLRTTLKSRLRTFHPALSILFGLLIWLGWSLVIQTADLADSLKSESCGSPSHG